MTVTVDELEVADPVAAWTRAGFRVDSDPVCRVGGVRIRLVGRGREAAPPATSAPVTDAVQRGRRITTLRHHEFGMSVRTALVSAPASR